MRAIHSKSTLVSLVLSVFVGSLLLIGAGRASALSGNQFNASNIIGDGVFFNPGAMTTADIQAFLNSKVPVCDTNGTQPYAGTTRGAYGTSRGYPPPYTCLKDYVQAVPTMPADSYCPGTVAGGNKTAAQIIYDVAQACVVSPKVLIVLLQKEQSLVTDDWPWSIQYTAATGYGCPDTASCDPSFAGFFNQVYYAARQYQRYAKQPQLFNYRFNQVAYIQYNPNGGCGGTNVHIQNQATAGLYNYTPYQPNAAALNNLYGTGDGCSAYGNRNFWRMFSDWFGSTQTNTPYALIYQSQEAFSDADMTQPYTSVPTVAPGGTLYVRIKALNVGNQAWSQSVVRAATSNPIDRDSIFAAPSWISSKRAVSLLETSVSPGQVGTFQFALRAPNTAGTYREYFNILAEGITWFYDYGLYYNINVVSPISPPNTGNTSLSSGATLNKGQHLLSPDAQSVLILQNDGNLVLYSNYKPVWDTQTVGSGANKLIMQPDGNLVLYKDNQALWNTQTSTSGSRVVLQTDGNMVVYSSGNVPQWATYTLHNPDHLAYVNIGFSSTNLYPGQRIETPNRSYKMILQPDGNLVLYSPNRAIWATGTDGRQVSYLALQPDGNLVLYDINSQPLWNSQTAGRGPSSLIMQDDGNLVLYDGLGRPIWNTNTPGVQ